ncbi:ABC transporter ATP-binding protein [Streptantibioticus cattleyicolor]|uniref:ABC transporter ATP-binding protein n=1 Tax=Streptantibioticus cattleyicolor (strain ATCC 35852 / DSM 46488 / JCM 4925 / NBRC 14057 / NRRL 8057) TaxID=1003195 RepID=F8JN89_STREN|nr:ABC transporter ATP-binding protein [Streptantibioticus cattleyicolor]AEW99153.1 ABC transporter ATP-binding protein [Streptantibioticus cattleyicolor NRRL 8057 = DSM 46488]CCB71804.1 putative spermidine/putrescine transporter subunit; ATP-binding component of ABC superfamily tranporter [Streptantibioticus cattleyicolor NRRL 8057 = DSM 46488]
MGEVATPAVRLTGVRMEYGRVRAVDGVDLEVPEGEFFALLGPSGSGKTTLLRLIAGFETPTAGRVELGGAEVTALPPYRRDVHTVFQDYALFPQMTVAENVAYALTVRRVPRAERRARAREALAMVRLAGHEGRRPGQLSGGQRQRVALARALVDRPRVLLLDEPLGALDLKLRQEMQTELKALQRTTGITFLLVTHDQEEAMTMSDRIAVVRDGRIEQTGPPAEVYRRPATAFVASFIGTANLLDGTTGIRPERLRLAPPGTAPGPDERAAAGRIDTVTPLGPHTRITVALDDGGRLTVLRPDDGRTAPVAAGGRTVVLWNRDHVFRIP